MKLLLYSLQGLPWQQMNAAGNLITFLSAPVPFRRQCRSQQHFLLILQVAWKMSNSPPEGPTRAFHLSRETLFKYLEGSLMFFSQHLRFCAFSLRRFRNCAAQRHFPSLLVLAGCTTHLEAESQQKLFAPPAHPTGRGGGKRHVKVGVVCLAGKSAEKATVSPSCTCLSWLRCGLETSAHLITLMGKSVAGWRWEKFLFPHNHELCSRERKTTALRTKYWLM